MIGSLILGSSPSTTCKSVWHTAHTSILTSISPAPGVGCGKSTFASGLVVTSAVVFGSSAFISTLPKLVLLQESLIIVVNFSLLNFVLTGKAKQPTLTR